MNKLRERIRAGDLKSYQKASDNAILFEGRICIPRDDELKNTIMSETHDTPYTAHPGGTKMYQVVKNRFLWDGMK